VRTTSTAVRRSSPAAAASDSPSSDTQVHVNARRLFTSFMVVPAPTGPRWNVARPSRSSTGRQRANRLVVATDHEDQLRFGRRWRRR
jgi:hypothetical protein